MYYGDSVKSSFSCSDSTCCLVTFCDNVLYSCSNLKYDIYITGELNDGAITGIVVGSIVFLSVAAYALLYYCRRNASAASEGSATYVQINPQATATGYQQQPHQAYQKHQPYQQAPQTSQEPAYNAQPQGRYPGVSPQFMVPHPQPTQWR